MFCFDFDLLHGVKAKKKHKNFLTRYTPGRKSKHMYNLDESGELSSVKMGLARGERIPSYHTINLLTYTSSSCNMRFILLVILFSSLFALVLRTRANN